MRGRSTCCLTLAREQKVDLTKISILRLADQYLAFIAAARRLKLEIAADYLVMAAWLAYLKSRLLLPQPPGQGEPSGDELAAALAHRLQRLEAMQQAGARLFARPLLGRDVFRRGAPEGLPRETDPGLGRDALRAAEGLWRRAQRQEAAVLHIAPAELYSMDDALQRLSRVLGRVPEWRTLMSFLPAALGGGAGAALGRRRDFRRQPGAGALRQAPAAPGHRLRPDLSPQPARSLTRQTRRK